MAYGSNSLGQENALGYPYPKPHPYYGWGWGGGHQGRQPMMIGDPGISPVGYGGPPGNWFGRPVVGALPTIGRESQMAVQAGTGLLVGGAAYVMTKSVIGALLGGGAAALLVTLLPIWADSPDPNVRVDPSGRYQPRY